MDSMVESGRRSIQRFTSSNYASGSTRLRKSIRESNSFIHDSYNSSLDFPTYIPWQTLSSDVSDKLKNGSIRINKWLVEQVNIDDASY